MTSNPVAENALSQRLGVVSATSVIAGVLLLWLPLFGAEAGEALDLRPVNGITIDRVDIDPSSGVTLAFRALDEDGRLLPDLRAVDVVVENDGRDVEFARFEKRAAVGAAVVFAFDTSRTMLGRPIDHMRRTALALVENLAANDRVAVLLIGNTTRLLVGFEDTRAHLLAELQMLEADSSSTSPIVWDGVAQSLHLLRGETRPGTILLFSDGRDQGSKATPASLQQDAQAGPGRSSISIHSVAYHGRGKAGLPGLTALAQGTGGIVQSLDRATSLDSAQLIPRGTTYQLEFLAELDGSQHEIRIAVEDATAQMDVRFPLVVERRSRPIRFRRPTLLTAIAMLSLIGLLFTRIVQAFLRRLAWPLASPGRSVRSYDVSS